MEKRSLMLSVNQRRIDILAKIANTVYGEQKIIMTTIPATDAKNKFGELLDIIHQEPVEISKKGRPVAVVVSIADYQEMQEKIAQSETKVNFSWLKTWRNKVQKLPNAKTLDEADYYQHLDEKYSS